jgi:hypothetical protein
MMGDKTRVKSPRQMGRVVFMGVSLPETYSNWL